MLLRTRTLAPHSYQPQRQQRVSGKSVLFIARLLRTERALHHADLRSAWSAGCPLRRSQLAYLRCWATTHLSHSPEQVAKFDALLEKGEHYTFHHPHGQLHGRAGRRCVLEDGERLLLRCISLKPTAIRPRLVLMQNLLLQNRGREAEVPSLVLATLQHTRLRQSSLHTPFAQQALIAVQLGIAALKAGGKEYKVHAFLQDAAHVVPDLIDPIDELEAESKKSEERQGTAFDSTVSYDDLGDF